jgi:ribosomal protein L22
LTEDPKKQGAKPDDAETEATAEESKEAAAVEAAEAKAEASADEPEAAETPADDPKAEAKPKPKRARRKKAEPKADADDAKKDAAEEDAEAEAAEVDGEPPAEDEKARPKRRRGAAEVTAGRKQPARRRSPEEIVTVRAKAKYVRTAPRKARLVIDHIRGKPVEDARALLLTTPRAASRDVLKLLDSAIANAENNHELVADELVVGRAYVDEGPTLKRFRPRALGRATQIKKRTSHMTIELTNQTTNGKQG